MCRKLIYLISFVVLLSAVSSVQALITVTTADGNGADTYLSNDAQSGDYGPNSVHGSEIRIRAFRQLADTRSKTGYIRFDLSDVAGDMNGATITFEATWLKGGEKSVDIYGLKDGPGDLLWDEATTSYNNAPGVIPNPPTTLGNYALNMDDVELLGTITTPAVPDPEVYPVSFSSDPNARMDAFISADTNKRVTFLFIGGNNEGEVASKEHDTFSPPTLTLPNAFPLPATNPNPANGISIESTSVILSWQAGAYADKHDVYFADNWADVNSADSDDPMGPDEVYKAHQDANNYPLTGLTFGTTYYWRIDEVNAAGPAPGIWRGNIWSFQVLPQLAWSPTPPDDTNYVPLNVTLRWRAGSGAGATGQHKVYFDTFSPPTTLRATLPVGDTNWAPSEAPLTLTYNTPYYWRIDEFNGTETYTGDEWDFKTVPHAPAEPNLVGWWKFDGDLTDSGYGCDGSAIGSPSYVTGLFDNPAIDINNANNAEPSDDIYVDVPIGSVISLLTNSTFAVWVNWRGTEGDRRNQRFFSFGTDPANYMFLAPRRSSSPPTHFEIVSGGVTERVSWGPYGPDGFTITANEWHHLAVTFNADTDTLTLYVDGVQEGITTDATLTPSDLGVTTQNWFGRCEDPAQQRPYRGYLDDLRIYDRALSAGEIAYLATPLKAWWPNPDDETIGAQVNPTLTWRPGYYADEHDVYFGADLTAVTNADTSDITGIYRGRQEPNNYPTTGVLFDTTYYWRVDEVNLAEDPNIIKGDVWSFTTREVSIITTSTGNGADTYLSNDGQSGDYGPNSVHSMEDGIEIRNYVDVRQKIAYLRFDISDVTEDMTDITLALNVVSSTRNRTWGVYGLIDESQDNWPEPNISYNTAPGFIPNPPTPLAQYAIDANLARLADFPVDTPLGWYYSEPNSLMDAFIAADTDGLLTFAIIMETSDDNGDWWMTSKEGDPNFAPRLVMPSPKATEPYPDDEADAPTVVVLSWKPGRYAAQHDIYFADNWADVNDANDSDPMGPDEVYKSRQDSNSYSVTGLLPSTTYYWRIDEVNMAEVPNIWRGDIWSFTTLPYGIVEDFDSYVDHDALGAVWKDYWTNGTSAEVYVETDPNFVQDGNSMRYWYGNHQSPYYSEAEADTADLPSQIGSDWTAGDIKALVLYFYGQSGNDANEQMYVALSDGSNEGVVTYGDYGEDPNDLRIEQWHEWNIDIEDFNSAGVDLTNVARITIGFGDGSAGGNGTVYFENIQLHPRRCVHSKRLPDFAKADYIPAGVPSGNCMVNYEELTTMLSNWLGAAEQIRLEAEDAAMLNPDAWQVRSDRADASGGKYIVVAPGYGAPNEPNLSDLVTYDFTVSGGTYKVFGRVVAPSDTEDSFWCRIPDATLNVSVPNDWVWWDVSEAAGNDWAWDEINSDANDDTTVQFTMSAGTHTLEIGYREQTLLDRLWITDDLDLDEATLLAWDADLNGDDKIDFKDFALLAKQWLIEQMWP